MRTPDGELGPVEWLDLARKYADKVCSRHPAWDADDLYSDILLICVKYEPRTYFHVGCCCSWAKKSWFRRKLGAEGKKAAMSDAIPFSTVEHTRWYRSGEEADDAVAILIGAEDTMTQGVEEGVFISQLGAELPPVAHIVASMFADGFTLRDIAYLLGIKRPEVERIAEEIRPVLERMLGNG